MSLTRWIQHTLVGFGLFNIVIGVTLLFYYPKVPFTVISPLIPQVLWALIFIMSGIITLVAMLRRVYWVAYYMMIIGLFIKVMWEIGFAFRILNGGTVFSVELWGMIAYFQFLGVIYFNPVAHDELR